MLRSRLITPFAARIDATTSSDIGPSIRFHETLMTEDSATEASGGYVSQRIQRRRLVAMRAVLLFIIIAWDAMLTVAELLIMFTALE